MPEPAPFREDEKFMRQALEAARKGLGQTHPNPAVGAVIVSRGRVLATGWHRAAGQPHAEIEAIRSLPSAARAKGATIYVTLEPCSTHGRTPPCTRAIIEAGFSTVVYGARDPDPRHRGRADRILRRHGITVRAGVLGGECASLNADWNKWIATGLPFVISKAGLSLDGRIASPPGRRWITSAAARADAMALRASCDAVIVGGETVRTDNPKLTIRGIRGAKQPWRVVWMRSGDLPAGCHLLSDKHRDRTIVYRGKSVAWMLKDLGRRGCKRVLIEGGGYLHGAAFDAGLVDRIVFYVAPVLMGGPVPAIGGRGAGDNAEGLRLKNPRYTLIGGDLRIEGDLMATEAL